MIFKKSVSCDELYIRHAKLSSVKLATIVTDQGNGQLLITDGIYPATCSCSCRLVMLYLLHACC